MEEKIEFTVKNRVKIKDDNFEILTPNNYTNLKRYNYNVKQLKTMCKHYKIPLKGNKHDIQLRLYNHLKLYIYATMIQKTWRGYLVRKINKIRGLENFSKECCNNQDFVTLEDIKSIPYLQFFSFVHKDKKYGFDVNSIYDYIVKRNNKENPYDRTIFSPKIKSNILMLKKLTKIAKQNTIFEIIEEKNININEIFNRIDQLGNYSDISWYTSLNYTSLLKFYKELYDIWIYRANLSLETKYNIATIDPFGNTKPNFYLNYSLSQLQNILLQVMKKLLYNATSEDYQKLGAMYILTALTIVSPSAAEAMPWYFSSVI